VSYEKPPYKEDDKSPEVQESKATGVFTEVIDVPIANARTPTPLTANNHAATHVLRYCVASALRRILDPAGLNSMISYLEVQT